MAVYRIHYFLLFYVVPLMDSNYESGPLEHSGENCWNRCNTKQGKCRWCGTEGWCCNKGTIGNGCDGLFGGNNEFQCVLKPGTASDQTAYSSIKYTKIWRRSRSIFLPPFFEFSNCP